MRKIERQPGAMRFDFQGMNTTNPPDRMPPNKYPLALNCRAYQAGAVGPRLSQGAMVDSGLSGTVHSLQRLNDNNISPGFGTWVTGSGTVLNVGSQQVATGFSGNRLGMASYRPNASPRPWIYIGDTNKAVKTNAIGSVGQVFNTGIKEPQVAAVCTNVSGGGGPTYPVFYQYKWRSSLTGASSNPSPPMRAGFTASGGDVPFVTCTSDPSAQGDLIDVYRQDVGLINMTYVTTLNNGALSFADTLTDLELIANPLMQFDDFEPFPSIDLPRAFIATVTSAHVLTWSSGDQFNTRWLPGTELQLSVVTGLTTSTVTLYIRPTSATVLTITEDLTGQIGNLLAFNISEPILGAQRLPALWGPTDNTGYFFSVGDPLRPGTLYFTKGNNPDSAPQTNQIEVTSPSEPLINGEIVNGLGIVMSTERGWLIYPNFGNAVATVIGVQGSPFQLIETIEGYGLYAKEGICTDGGANLFFWSKEGIRISQGGLGSQSLTDDDLFNLFPHEGQPQQSYTLAGITINPPDYTNPNSFALRFAEGYLYADYQDTGLRWWTLVFDVVNKAWSVDDYQFPVAIHADFAGQGIGTAMGTDEGDHGSVRLFDPTASEDSVMHLAVPCFDAGDLRATKRFADIYTEAAVELGDPVNLTLYTNRYQTNQTAALSAANLLTTGGVRSPFVIDLALGAGIYSTDLGMVFDIPLAAFPASLMYAWQPAIVPQPETTDYRFTDWEDGGTPGAKFVQGCLIEADTANLVKSIAIQSGDDLSLNIPIEMPAQFNGQSTKAFSLATPFIAHTFRLAPQDVVAWRIWDVKWIFVPYPELATEWQTEQISHGMEGWQHIKEINLPYLSAVALTLTLKFDSQSTPSSLVIAVPASGTQIKQLVIVPANKFKLVSYGLTGSSPFRLWKEDMEVKVGQWGRTDSYKIIRPFGGSAAMGASV